MRNRTIRIHGRKWRVSRYDGGWCAHSERTTRWGKAYAGIAAPTLRELRAAMHDSMYYAEVGNV